MVHSYNPSYTGGERGEWQFQTSMGKKMYKTTSQPIAEHGSAHLSSQLFWRLRSGKTMVSLAKKCVRPCLKRKNLGVVVRAIIPATVGYTVPATVGYTIPATVGKIVAQDSLCKKQNPISKITRGKRAGGVAQAVECLSPNPSTAKK
jgi:hypothetical protein